MARDRLLIGQVANRTGLSRKALRLYEAAGILPRPARTPAGYRVYGDDVLGLLQFVTRARRLGFSLAQIKMIVALKQTGQSPCAHVRTLVERRAADLERTIEELSALRSRLGSLLAGWQSREGRTAAICPHIEHRAAEERRKNDGANDDLSVPRLRPLSRVGITTAPNWAIAPAGPSPASLDNVTGCTGLHHRYQRAA